MAKKPLCLNGRLRGGIRNKCQKRSWHTHISITERNTNNGRLLVKNTIRQAIKEFKEQAATYGKL